MQFSGPLAQQMDQRPVHISEPKKAKIEFAGGDPHLAVSGVA
jgi:hypothetical protein